MVVVVAVAVLFQGFLGNSFREVTVVVNERRTFVLELDGDTCTNGRIWADENETSTAFNTCLDPKGGMSAQQIVEKSSGSSADGKYTVDGEVEVRRFRSITNSSSVYEMGVVKQVYSVTPN